MNDSYGTVLVSYLFAKVLVVCPKLEGMLGNSQAVKAHDAVAQAGLFCHVGNPCEMPPLSRL